MTKYIVPEVLRPHLKKIPNGDTILERGWITTNDLLYVHHMYLRDANVLLSQLTSDLKPYQPPKQSTGYTPEFQKQLDILRAKAEEEQYQSMVYQLNRNKDETPAQMAKEVKNQITTIFNVFISVGSVVYAVWYWTHSSGYFGLGTRVLLCLFAGILTLVAEVVMFNAFQRRVKESREKERKKKVINKVTKTFVL